MYTGHAAIALLLKSRAPQVPVAALVLASYGPDLWETSLMIPVARAGTGIYTHSLAAIVIGAGLAGTIYGRFRGGQAGRMIALAWALHLLADLVTGLKPLIVQERLTGLDLYHVGWADAVVECLLILVAAIAYGRACAGSRRQWRVVAALAVFLMALQIQFNLLLPRLDTLPWNPSLAKVPGERHFSAARSARVDAQPLSTPIEPHEAAANAAIGA